MTDGYQRVDGRVVTAFGETWNDETESWETPMAKAKKNGGRSDGVQRATYNKRLPVKVPVDRIDELARDLAENHMELESVKDKKREINAKYREKIVGLAERGTELATGIRAGTEIRDVPCVELLYVETNEIHVVRKDTGEVVEQRTATAEDRQESLLHPDHQTPPKKRGRPRKDAVEGVAAVRAALDEAEASAG